jgi:sodium transport system permease protein
MNAAASAANRIWNVFSKEVLDNLRDRRSVISALASSLIGPILLLILIVIIGKSFFKDQTENPLRLPVAGAENAPSLVRFLEQNGAEILPAPVDPETEVRNGNVELVLVIPEGYGEEFTAGQPAPVRLVIDSSRQSALASVERANRLLEAYSQQIGSLRLLARGVNPSVIQTLAVERADVATPQSQALIFLNMMPYFIVMVVFLGGMYVIIDATAGERERGSLEPLLINPLARWEFVLGKLAASLPFAVFTVLLTLAAFALAFNAFPLEDYIGIQLSIHPAALGGIFLISLPMILLASALQMIIATFTRSFKEAQTYVAFLPLIPALPGIGLAFLPVKASLWTMLIPTFGQQLLINQMMRGEAISTLNVLVSTLATLVLAIALIFVAMKLYEREKILFGTK